MQSTSPYNPSLLISIPGCSLGTDAAYETLMQLYQVGMGVCLIHCRLLMLFDCQTA